MSLSLQLVIRLLTAALLGAAIGYEREFRAKNAGVRTHILVALGSALFMIISQFGFPEDARFDAARVAAGVVTGIGFIGGGIIMKKKHVSGLTTAASLWVTGAVGLSAGSGMFEVSILCTILVLLCLEALNLYSFKLGRNEVTAVLSSLEMSSLKDAIRALGEDVVTFSLSHQGERCQVEISLNVSKRESMLDLLTRLSSFPGVRVESLE